MEKNNTTNKKNQSNHNKSNILGENTIVQLRFKTFISIILTILAIFFGFYKLVIQPNIHQTAKHQKEMYMQQKEYMNKEFEEVKNAIKINTNAIEATNERFRELNKTFRKIKNSDGSFGSRFSIDIDSLNIVDSLNIQSDKNSLADKN